MEKIDHIIIENLVLNEDYTRNVLPHLKNEYFDTRVDRIVFEFIQKFFQKHNKVPTKKILNLVVSEYPKFTEDEYSEAKSLINDIEDKEENIDWLNERTEKFCKDRAIYLALTKSIQITDGQDKNYTIDAIPSILQEALSVSFDKEVGHDYIGDYEHRWDFYHLLEKKIPFPLKIFNKITNGGLSSKTLNVLLMMCVHPDTKIKVRIKPIK